MDNVFQILMYILTCLLLKQNKEVCKNESSLFVGISNIINVCQESFPFDFMCNFITFCTRSVKSIIHQF